MNLNTNLDWKIIFKGHDTTTAAIVFTLHLISRHKPVQDRLFDEIVNVIGSNRTTPATFQHLSSLKYMEAVIKESLRMYAPVPFIGRYLDNDIVLGMLRHCYKVN